MRIRDWSSDVCSSDLKGRGRLREGPASLSVPALSRASAARLLHHAQVGLLLFPAAREHLLGLLVVDRRHDDDVLALLPVHRRRHLVRSEEHTSELQSLMRTSYAVFCLKKTTKQTHAITT